MDILSLFACFETLAATATIRQLAIISQAILTTTGRVTMLSLSRWTERGGSYRTIQRFFGSPVPWDKLLVKFFATHLFDSGSEYILAGDATTVTKAGKQTFGIDRFFSGLLGKAVNGLEFFVLSLVDVGQRKAYPVMVKQMVRTEAEKKALKARKKKRLKKTPAHKPAAKGRRKGSRNRDKTLMELSAELMRINELLTVLLKLARRFVKVGYLALDGHFGHQQAVLMARANDLHLISKLRRDAALFEKYIGTYGGRGPRKKYGERLRYDLLPMKYLKTSEREKDVITNYYQGGFLHKEFGVELNVVIIVKINLKTRKLGHAILFSSDLELSWAKLVGYYSLRFQIEFNFRDAKQHFGLEDFMTTSETGVENAANLAFLMVQVSAKLSKQSDGKWVGVNDLKTHYRGVKYALETIKLVLEKPEPILINRVKEEIGKIGSIHAAKIAASSP